jgi:hypothetical protein
MTLVFLKDPRYLHLITLDRSYVTIVAPAAGILLAKTYIFTANRLQRTKQFEKLKKKLPTRIIGTKTFYKIVYHLRIGFISRNISLVSIYIYRKIAAMFFIRSFIMTSYTVMRGAIVFRCSLRIIDLVRYYLDTRNNLLKMAFKSLLWIVYYEKRSLALSLSFAVVTLLTAIIWCKYPAVRKFIFIWTMVTSLNISDDIQVLNSPFLRTYNFGAFGLPVIERPVLIQRFKPTIELMLEPGSNFIGKEKALLHSFPHENEIAKVDSKNLDIETNKIINNSILGKEQFSAPRKERLKRGKTRKIRATSKTKRRVNTLKTLKSRTDNLKSGIFESELNNFSNSTKIKEEKVF